MSEETVLQGGGADARPKGLLQQMEELMAALNVRTRRLWTPTSSQPGDQGRQAGVEGQMPTEACGGMRSAAACAATQPASRSG